MSEFEPIKEVIKVSFNASGMSIMSVIDEVRSWLWVPLYWAVAYVVALFAGIAIGTIATPELYWSAAAIVILAIAIPATYRNLVGGGCSLRFQICALVKGAMVGLIFMIAAMLVDPLMWSWLESTVGWSALSVTSFSSILYQIWFYAGIIGGFGARIVEVRGMSSAGDITIAGYE